MLYTWSSSAWKCMKWKTLSYIEYAIQDIINKIDGKASRILLIPNSMNRIDLRYGQQIDWKFQHFIKQIEFDIKTQLLLEWKYNSYKYKLTKSVETIARKWRQEYESIECENKKFCKQNNWLKVLFLINERTINLK